MHPRSSKLFSILTCLEKFLNNTNFCTFRNAFALITTLISLESIAARRSEYSALLPKSPEWSFFKHLRTHYVKNHSNIVQRSVWQRIFIFFACFWVHFVCDSSVSKKTFNMMFAWVELPHQQQRTFSIFIALRIFSVSSVFQTIN